MAETPNELLQRLTAKPAKTSKYRNKVIERDGIRYDSKAEYAYKGVLDTRVRAKEIRGYDFHVRLPLIAEGGGVVGYYEIDYLVYTNDGGQEYHDVKSTGSLTETFSWKARHVKAQYGNPIILIDSKTLKPKVK